MSEGAVTRLNHAVLFVRDAAAASAFYQEAFGFTEVAREMGGQAIFLHAAGSENHHDLGLFSVGPGATGPQRGSVGLYHLAWEVATIDDLAAMANRLSGLRALTGTSDHGVSTSLYGRDIDGNEFEVMWRVPRDHWGEDATRGVVRPLDLERELERYGGGKENAAPRAG
jgi:catechol-2,3-dioxygenase